MQQSVIAILTDYGTRDGARQSSSVQSSVQRRRWMFVLP